MKSNQVPEVYTVESISHETDDVFTLVLASRDGKRGKHFVPGQFNMLNHFGYGEAAISISGDPQNQEKLVHTIRALGCTTKRMQELSPGDEIGLRGPFGTSWPVPPEGSNVLLIAGGLGLAPLRPVLYRLAANRDKYARVRLIYGVKEPSEIIYRQELKLWREQGIEIEQTVDVADAVWKGHVGVVTPLVAPAISDANKTCAMLCGPEIMMRFVIKELLGSGVVDKNIFISLERNMQCGVGTCGHCQMGPFFVCKDGPVFSYEQVQPWFWIKEL